jgi:hypothetical protein
MSVPNFIPGTRGASPLPPPGPGDTNGNNLGAQCAFGPNGVIDPAGGGGATLLGGTPAAIPAAGGEAPRLS